MGPVPGGYAGIGPLLESGYPGAGLPLDGGYVGMGPLLGGGYPSPCLPLDGGYPGAPCPLASRRVSEPFTRAGAYSDWPEPRCWPAVRALPESVYLVTGPSSEGQASSGR